MGLSILIYAGIIWVVSLELNRTYIGKKSKGHNNSQFIEGRG
jgi:hypothetical protein